MIHTSKQLKDKVRNLSKGDNTIAKVLIRNFLWSVFWNGYLCQIL